MNKFFKNTHLNNLINQKITNILWNARASLKYINLNNGTSLPVEYTCDGEDRSPALSWNTVPAGTQSIALIVEEPDAPVQTFVYWVTYNIPANSSGLPGAVPRNKTLDEGDFLFSSDLLTYN